LCWTDDRSIAPMMKYLTLDRWLADQDLDERSREDSRQAAEQYWAYLASIRPRLPAALSRLLDEFTIHDGRVRELYLSVAERTLTIRLDAHDHPGDGRKYQQRHLRPQYRGVAEVKSTADPSRGSTGSCSQQGLSSSSVSRT
jgi:hypothetical protein